MKILPTLKILDSPPLNRYDFSQMRNMWEVLVYQTVAELLEKNEMCDCQDCVLDTCALALNNLPPSYWILGSYDAFMPPERFIEDGKNIRLAEEAVLKAYRLVQQNPHH
jgi:competence protein ComFB